MQKPLIKIVGLCAGLALALSASPAFARHHHHRHHAKAGKQHHNDRSHCLPGQKDCHGNPDSGNLTPPSPNKH
jgi:uncharacterized membrane protein